MPIIIRRKLFSDKFTIIPDHTFCDSSLSNDNIYTAFVDLRRMSVWNLETKELTDAL